MKKLLVGSLVGGLIIFLWQFLSFALIDFHKSSHQYTDKQDAIMSFLNNQGLKEGGYVVPSLPEGSSMDEHNKLMKASEGKPWIIIQYHDKMENDMVMNMARGFFVDIVTVFLLSWIIGKMAAPRFGTIVATAIAVGLIAFFYEPYTGSIWYKLPDIWGFLLDAVAAWGLTGVWLGWWLRKGRSRMNTVRVPEREKEYA